MFSRQEHLLPHHCMPGLAGSPSPCLGAAADFCSCNALNCPDTGPPLLGDMGLPCNTQSSPCSLQPQSPGPAVEQEDNHHQYCRDKESFPQQPVPGLLRTAGGEDTWFLALSGGDSEALGGHALHPCFSPCPCPWAWIWVALGQGCRALQRREGTGPLAHGLG